MIKKMVFQFVLKQIEKADDFQISGIIQAVIKRYTLVFPDWEVMFLSLPNDPKARRKQLEIFLQSLIRNEDPNGVEA